MNAQMPMLSPPVNMIRLPYPIEVSGPPHLVAIIVLPDCAEVVWPGESSPAFEDLDEEPTWEDAECL